MLIDGFVEASRKTFGKVSDGERVVDVEVSVAKKFFKLGNVTVWVLRVHLEALHDDGPSLLFLQNIGVLLTEGYDSAVVQPWIPRIHSFLVYLALEPSAHRLNPFGHIVPLKVREEE